ncbi:hypothetical protein BDB13_5838 [Rhodococcus sp. OK302]|nr:hypothetical protein BDB13_5838 [Rhodococcus sp. OK302]
MRHDDWHAPRNWLFRCSRCDHWYRTAARNESAADFSARTNGWVVGENPLCPGCASVAIPHPDTNTSIDINAA